MCFPPLWRWGLGQLQSRKEGYTLDLDSTRLIHEGGHQDGVREGYTRLAVKPCLYPLLACGREPSATGRATVVADRPRDVPQQMRLPSSSMCGAVFRDTCDCAACALTAAFACRSIIRVAQSGLGPLNDNGFWRRA